MMQAALQPPASLLLVQLQQAVNQAPAGACKPQIDNPTEHRHVRQRGGANTKMDSAEDYEVSRSKPAAPPKPAAPLALVEPQNNAALNYTLLLHRERDAARLLRDAADVPACDTAADQELQALDSLEAVAADYQQVAAEALAAGAWELASKALMRSQDLQPPRGAFMQAWRSAMAAVRLGQGNAQAATCLLQLNSAHPDDLRAAWRGMARQFTQWHMPALADQARGLAGDLGEASRQSVLESMAAGESPRDLAEKRDLTPQQLAAYSNFIQAFHEER